VRAEHRSTGSARIIGLAAAGLAAVLVAGCGGSSGGASTPAAPTSAAPAKLMGDDFQGVCSGATVTRATPYVASAPQHKVILFSPGDNSLTEDTGTLPPDWIVQFDANSDAYAKVDTVACVRVHTEHPVKECTDYKDDDKPTGNKVDLNTATYTVTVHEATTGKQLATAELDGTDDSCPMFMTFDGDHQTKKYDAPPSKDALIAFLKPFVHP
jgi:hypothetical protein